MPWRARTSSASSGDPLYLWLGAGAITGVLVPALLCTFTSAMTAGAVLGVIR